MEMLSRGERKQGHDMLDVYQFIQSFIQQTTGREYQIASLAQTVTTVLHHHVLGYVLNTVHV